MAHFRRRRPRTSGGNKRKGMAEVTWRKRHNLKPYRIPEFDVPYFIEGQRNPEWCRLWDLRRNICYPDSAPSQMSNYPKWWDIMHHTRPTRRKNQQVLHGILRAKVDPEGAFWRDGRRPHIYYW